MSSCRGQCYDEAANMAGIRNGVAAQMCAEEPRATYTHCYGHALNLAASDTVKKNKILCDVLDTVFEITKLLKFSPKRDALFTKLKQEITPGTPGFRTLCPTRWTVRAASLKSVIDNYLVFQALWEEVKDAVNDSEIRARVIGVNATMNRFDFLFGLVLAERLLQHTDNLSKTLQARHWTEYEMLKHLTSSGTDFRCYKENLVWMKLVYHERERFLVDWKLVLPKPFTQVQQRTFILNSTLSVWTLFSMQLRTDSTNLVTKHLNNWKICYSKLPEERNTRRNYLLLSITMVMISHHLALQLS